MSDGKFHLRSIGWLPLLAVVLFLFPGCSNPDKTVEKTLITAQAQLDAGEPQEAIRILEKLNQDFPDRLNVVEFLAFTYASNKNPAEAAAYFLAATQLAPRRSDLHLFAAQALESTNDLEGAATQYRLFIVDNFTDFAGWQALARIEQRRGNNREAIDAFLNVYRIRPSDETAVAIGDLYLQLNNTVQAHRWYDTALSKNGKAAPAALLGLLKISLEEENRDRAQELTDELDESFPGYLDSSELASVRGEFDRWRNAQEEEQRIQEEKLAESKRQEAEEKTAEEETRLARLQEEEEAMQREREALAAQAQAETPEPTVEEPTEPEPPSKPEPNPYRELLEKARRTADGGRSADAASFYWQALAYDDTDAQVWFELSRVQYRREAFSDAELTALEALRRNPQQENYHLHYLNVIKETQPVRTYLRELERTHEMFYSNPEIALALANTYIRGHHSQAEAIRYYRLFIQLAPADPRRDEAEKTLRKLTE